MSVPVNGFDQFRLDQYRAMVEISEPGKSFKPALGLMADHNRRGSRGGTRQPAKAAGQPLDRSIFLEGFDHIAATGWLESARRAEQGAESDLVQADHHDQDSRHCEADQRNRLLSGIGFMVLAWPRGGGGFEPPDHISGQGRQRSPHGGIADVCPSRQDDQIDSGGNSDLLRRKASRTSRFSRLRAWAARTFFRDTEMPRRG